MPAEGTDWAARVHGEQPRCAVAEVTGGTAGTLAVGGERKGFCYTSAVGCRCRCASACSMFGNVCNCWGDSRTGGGIGSNARMEQEQLQTSAHTAGREETAGGW